MTLEILDMNVGDEEWSKEISLKLHAYEWLQLIANTTVALKHPEFPKMSEVVSKSICKGMTEKIIKEVPTVLGHKKLISEWKEVFNTITDKWR